MDLQFASTRQSQVEEFQRKHHTELVTMLFSDVVGSTKLKQHLGDREAVALLQRHDAIIREVLARFEKGEEIATAGDAFFIVFARPSDAVKFALMVQSALRRWATATGRQVFDRIGIHVGEVWVSDENSAGEHKQLYGIQVDMCARVASLGEADQILMTRFAFDSTRQVIKGEELEGIGLLSWLDHGPYLLKGVEESIEMFEVGEAGLAALQRPKDAEKARRVIAPDSEPVLGWRPAMDQPVPGTNWILEKKLGEGGFGEVWLGRDKVLKTRHVFKFCFSANRVRSLKREVTLFRLLKERVGSHPNIVGVRHVYFDDPPFYIVMDFTEGEESLALWFEERGGVDKVPLMTRLEIVAQVADALQVAQGAGIIHRDVKPSNILVSGEGTTPADVHVRLTDFGIGQVISQEVLAGLTQAGFTQTVASPGSSAQAGSHMYMAPELLAGKPASTGSDIYSLGLVLYQLLVGDLSAPLTVDWASRVSDPLLRDDLARAFAGDPHRRFAGAGQLGSNLRALENRRVARAEEQASIKAKENRKYHWGVIRTAALDAPLLASLTGWVLYHSDDESGQYDFASAYNIPMYAFISVIIAMYLGISAGVRAVMRDRVVLQRDGRLDISPFAYIGNRTLVLSLLLATQCALFVYIGNSILEVRGMFAIYCWLTFLTGLSGICAGLLIGSLIKNRESATRIMWLVMIPQLVFGGALIKYNEMNHDLDAIYSVKRWFSTNPASAGASERDDSRLKIPLISRFLATHYSYEALIVAQAKLNPLAVRQGRIQAQIDALVANRRRNDQDDQRLEDLKDALALLTGQESGTLYEVEKRLLRVDRVIDGGQLERGMLLSRTGGVTAERLYANQRVNFLVNKAEAEQSDYGRTRSINVYFSPEKHYHFFTLPKGFFNADREIGLRMSTYFFNLAILLLSSAALLGLLYFILKRQTRSRPPLFGPVRRVMRVLRSRLAPDYPPLA